MKKYIAPIILLAAATVALLNLSALPSWQALSFIIGCGLIITLSMSRLVVFGGFDCSVGLVMLLASGIAHTWLAGQLSLWWLLAIIPLFVSVWALFHTLLTLKLKLSPTLATLLTSGLIFGGALFAAEYGVQIIPLEITFKCLAVFIYSDAINAPQIFWTIKLLFPMVLLIILRTYWDFRGTRALRLLTLKTAAEMAPRLNLNRFYEIFMLYLSSTLGATVVGLLVTFTAQNSVGIEFTEKRFFVLLSLATLLITLSILFAIFIGGGFFNRARFRVTPLVISVIGGGALLAGCLRAIAYVC